MAGTPGTFRFPEVNAKPSAPPSGYALLYIKIDNVLYLQDSSGTEIPLGSASSITQLTGDVTAIGPGASAATVVTVGGASAASIATAVSAYLASTSSNTPNTLVKRDGSGNFFANAITAILHGNADTATTSISFSGSLSGDVTGTQGATTVASVGGSSASDIHSAELLANTATPSNTPNSVVERDSSGDFSAGTIIADLIGSASDNVLKSGDTMTGDLSFGSAHKVTNLATPTSPGDATDKAYVDAYPASNGIQNTGYGLSPVYGSTSGTITQGSDSRLSTFNVVKVKKNPGAGEFLTIEAAMASITTNSSSNPFVINWGPGVYTINNSSGPLVIKPYVSVVAEGQYAVIAQPQDPTQDLFLVNSAESAMRNLIIQNVTGPVAAAIRVTRSEVPFLLDHVKFINCTECMVLDSSSFPVEVAARSIRIVSGSNSIRFARCSSSASQRAVLRIYTSLCTEDSGTAFVDGILVTGPGARLDANTLLMRSTTGTGNGVHISNGGEFVSQSGVEFEGFTKNFWIENSGANPIARTTTIMLRNGITADLQIDHPGALGSIEAKANTSTKVFVNTSAPIKLVLTDPSASDAIGIFVKGDILQADRFDRRANLSKLLRETTTLGISDGGAISVVAGLQINVAAGAGFLNDPTDFFIKEVPWVSTNITLNANTNNYLYVDTDGTIQVNTILPSLETVIPLGRVVTELSVINFVEHSSVSISHASNKIEDLLRDALGPIFSSGAVVTEDVVPLKIDVTAGEYFYGINLFEISGGAAITWESIYRDGSGDFILGTQSTADNAFYDDGSGTLAPLSSGFYAKHTLYVIGDGGAEKYFLVYSQAQYLALVSAQNAPLPLIPGFISDAVTRIAGIVVQQGFANLVETIDLRPRLGFAAPATTAASDHGNLTGLLNDDHPQYLIRTGIRPMTGPLTSTDTTQSVDKDTGSIVTEGGIGADKNINAGGTILGSNLSGTNTGDASVTDSNSIDLTLTGQNIQASLNLSTDAADSGNVKATSTIHSGGGAGLHVEYPFAAPVQIGTANSAGSASSISLSDHVHDHGAQTSPTLHAVASGSAHGFMSSTDKSKLDASTNANTAGTLVQRNGSGNFAAGTITANLAGNATTATSAINFSGSLSGDVTGTQGATVVSFIGGSSAANVHSAELLANASTSLNTASTIVRRDASGNFTASVITSDLIGNVTGNVSGTSANVTGIVAIVNGGTNSSAALANDRIMVSSGGAIVEASAITASRALVSNTNGIPIQSVTSSAELAFVSGVTSAIQTQLNGKQATGNYITALTGDVTASGPGSSTATIAVNVVSNSKLAQMPANTIKGNNTGLTTNTLDLTISQVVTLLAAVTTVGSFNGGTANANGATITSPNILFQSASTSFPGMVDTIAQSFVGAKTFTSNVTISTGSTTALVLNSTAFVFDSINNVLGIGISAPSTAAFVDAVNSTGTSKTLQLTGYGTGSTVGTRGRFARGTSGSPTAAQTGDTINFWSARGYGASQFAAASTAAISAIAGENFTNTSNLTYLTFNTTPTGSVTSAESMRIASTGITLGPQSASTAIHVISGGVTRTTRTITGSLTIDTTTTDDIIFCNQSAGISITLPTPTNGRCVTIKDISGTTETNNITVVRHASEKIENLTASKILYTNFGSWTFTADGTNWWMT